MTGIPTAVDVAGLFDADRHRFRERWALVWVSRLGRWTLVYDPVPGVH